MDYNESDNFKSHKLVAATKGWADSLGYKVNVKPNNQIATKAADHHCKEVLDKHICWLKSKIMKKALFYLILQIVIINNSDNINSKFKP